MAFDFYNPSKDIPPDIKYRVRQNCGHGCVVCGTIFFSFVSLNPKFSLDDPKNIALLCPSCHRKIRQQSWSKARAKLAMRFPKCHQTDYKRSFSLAGGLLSLQFAGARLTNCPSPIKVAGRPLFSIKPPVHFPEPLLFSCYLMDSTHKVSLVIEDNEWIESQGNWDLTFQGSRISIQEQNESMGIILRVDRARTVVIEALSMRLAGFHFTLDNDTLSVTQSPDSETMIASQILEIHPDIACIYL